MTVVSHRLPGVRRAVNGRTPLKALLDREAVFSWLLMALPFVSRVPGRVSACAYGLLLSLQDRPVAQTGTFVGFQNFVVNFNDPVFWQVAVNTFVYTGVATFLKMVGGLCLAVAMRSALPR